MIRVKSSGSILVAVTAFLVMMAWPSQASAQRRGHVRGPGVRSVVFVGGGFGYPRFFLYDPWYQPWRPYGPYGPYGPYRGYGYGYGPFDDLASSIRLDVEPRDAEVFVDGYAAGTVDDFDGIFQRLYVRPGGHEITIYLKGYRTIREQRYFRPGSNEKLRATMETLAAGETAEAPPQPSTAPVDRQAGPPPRRYEPSDRAPERAPETAPARFGTLALRVLPGDAELIVDGEKWTTPAGEDRTAIRLPEGRHRIEIQKDGYAKYVEEILIRRDQTLSLNVSLVRR